ncbi:MAG: adenylate kinase [Candidatus Saccharicenans sp.]|nr:MAG: adenylate kinase [Candidatus Aminicenantes bacterium]HEK86462.1 adenylate kinase [Candidatus Aminicenantes bacterium]
MRIILLGPAGSGKGTQADQIQKVYGYPKISTGDLLRKAVQDGTELGHKVKSIMEQGKLVDDEIVLELVREKIHRPECQAGYVLDGFPRNLNQGLGLEKIDSTRPETVFEILVTEEEILRRLSGRRVCLQCGAVYNINNNQPKVDGVCDLCGSRLIIREDDKPEVIKERFKIYLESIKPLVEYYQRRKVLFQIDGENTVENIFRSIKSIIDKRISEGRQSVNSK